MDVATVIKKKRQKIAGWFRPSFRGAFFSPREYPPDGERQVDGIEHCPAEQTRRDIKGQPSHVPNSPEVEAQDVLPDVQDRSCEADERDDPGEHAHHVKSPFLHISANRGSRRLEPLRTP